MEHLTPEEKDTITTEYDNTLVRLRNRVYFVALFVVTLIVALNIFQ